MSGIRPGAHGRAARAAAALALGILLSGCGPMIAGMPGIGEPAEAQKRPEVPPDFPTTFRPPPDPDAAKAMSATERAQAQTDLQTARDRAATDRRQQIAQPPSRPSE
jgi:hypothetical protein